MSLSLTLLVLLAAVLHAVWNAFVRADTDRLGAIARLALATSAITVLIVPFFAFPSRRAWVFLGATLVLHTAYNFFLAKAYEQGALGKVYPLARGTAPLIVALVSTLFLGEALPPTALAGSVLLAVAIISIAWQTAHGAASKQSVGYALLTSIFIAAYTLVDGLGGRAAQSPHVYVLWLFFLYGYPIAAIVLWRRGAAFLRAGRQIWAISFAGGAMSMAAYWIIIWAMKHAALGPVAALRETSVIIAVLISGLVMKEALSIRVFIAAAGVVLGIALLRL